MGKKQTVPVRLWLRQLGKDERGVVAVSDYILLGTIVAIGGIVGLVTLRNGLIQELGDVGIALENIQQNYTVTLEVKTISGPTTTKSFGYTADNNPTEQPAGQSTAGINLSLPPTGDG